MIPVKRTEAIGADLLAKLPKRGGKTIIGQVQKTELVDAENNIYETKTYYFYHDNTEECVGADNKPVEWIEAE